MIIYISIFKFDFINDAFLKVDGHNTTIDTTSDLGYDDSNILKAFSKEKIVHIFIYVDGTWKVKSGDDSLDLKHLKILIDEGVINNKFDEEHHFKCLLINNGFRLLMERELITDEEIDI